jgi:hypothetical protein
MDKITFFSSKSLRREAQNEFLYGSKMRLAHRNLLFTIIPN